MAIQSKKNLQDGLLNTLRKTRAPVTIFLMNGVQMRGIVTAFDSFVVLLVSDERQQIIYKHAISTIIPIRPIDLSSGWTEEEEGARE